MIDLAKFKFYVQGKIFGNPETTEPEKIREEPFGKLEVKAVAAEEGEESVANQVIKKALEITWHRFCQANLMWQFGARTVSAPDSAAKVEVYLLLREEFIRDLCRVLPQPALQVEGSLELGRKTKGPWSKVRLDCVELDQRLELVKPGVDSDSNSLSPWKLGVIPIQFFHGAEHDMRLRLCVKIGLDWSAPLDDDPATKNVLKIEDRTVVGKLFANGARTNVTIVGGDESQVIFHRSVLAHYGKEILRRLSQVGDGTWRLTMEEVGREAGLLLYVLMYGKAVPVDKFKFEIASQLLQAGHEYKLTKVEAGMAILLEQMEEEDFNTCGTLKLFFFLYKLDKEKKFKVHQELMDKVSRFLARMNLFMLGKSKVYQKLKLGEKDDLYWKVQEMRKKGVKRIPIPGESSELPYLKGQVTGLVHYR